MAITVKSLEPLNPGIPTHAPKLWRMPTTHRKRYRAISKRAWVRLLRNPVDLIDQLEPLSALRSAD